MFTFRLVTEPNGNQYLEQFIDEMHKNHTADDNTKTNEDKMYVTNGKDTFINLLLD